jgi:serine/threonine protein kinase
MHGNGMAHLDVKPDNILEGRMGQYKLADFGLARSTGLSNGIGQEGDSRYLPPEALEDKRDIQLDKVDMFSLGMSLYQLVTDPFLHRRRSTRVTNDTHIC